MIGGLILSFSHPQQLNAPKSCGFYLLLRDSAFLVFFYFQLFDFIPLIFEKKVS